MDQDSYVGRMFGHNNSPTSNAIKAKAIYDKQIKRYLGFGFLASFIPGTEAFLARTDYFLSLLEIHRKIENQLEGGEFYAKHFHTIGLTPLYFLSTFVAKFYEITATAKTNILVNRKDTLGDLGSYLPIVSDIVWYSSRRGETIHIQENWYKHLFSSLLNPIKLVSSALRFLHRSVDTFYELGTETRTESSLPRLLLKGISALFFIPIRLLVSLIEKTVDLGLSVLETLFIEPLRFGYEVVEQLLETWDKEYVYTPIEESNGIMHINNALDSHVYRDQIIETEQFNLKTLTYDEKINYIKDKNFYNQMKSTGLFANTANFQHISGEQRTKIKTFESQLDQWKKLRLFGVFAQSQVGVPDINNVISKNLVDLVEADVEAEVKKTTKHWPNFNSI